MLILKMVGIILFSTVISLVVTIIYIKALSVLKKQYGEKIRNLRLFQKICNPRTDSGQDGNWEVKSIYYFDKTYQLLNSYKVCVTRVIRYLWSNKKSYYTNQRYTKNPNRDLKGFLHNSHFQNFVGIFAIGFGIGVFLYIAVSIWPTAPMVLRVSLIAICVSAFFVGLFSLSKNYKPDSKKYNTTDNKLNVMITQNANKGADYHKTYTDPFYHMHPLEPVRRIINRSKVGVNQMQIKPLFRFYLHLVALNVFNIRWQFLQVG